MDAEPDHRHRCAGIVPGHSRIAIADQSGADVGDGQNAGLGCVPRPCTRHTWRSEDCGYIVDQFRALGLQPGGENGGWLQHVPLIHNIAAAPTRLEIRVGGSTLLLLAGRDINPQTLRPISRVTISAARMVFVGYGVAAPERNWDDFKGVDLHGKVAIFLVNDPDFEAAPDEPVAGKFGGRAMTYYGRWTYKFEEAARRGAIAAFVVHETAAAGYGWNVVSNTAGGTYDIVRPADQLRPVLLQAWLAREAAVSLFAKAGLDFEVLKRRARDPRIRPASASTCRSRPDVWRVATSSPN